MSQRGPAPGPASRRSSPAKEASSSSSPQPRPQHLPSRGHDPTATRRDDRRPAPAMVGDGRFPRSAPRTSGVHNILNPSAAHQHSAPSRPEPESMLQMDQPSPYGESSRGPPRPLEALAHPPPGLETAHASSLYTPLAPARRMLTPRSPRAGVSTRASSSLLENQSLPLPPQVPLSGPRIGQAPYSASGPGPGPGPPLTRSLSRPTSRQGFGLNPARDGRASLLTTSPDATAKPPPPPPLPQSRPQAGLQGGPFRGPGQEAGASWSSGSMGMRGPGNPMGTMVTMSRGMSTPEGQHLISFMPPHGEEILVPVDVHQASKQADEKRQRNARASARFRMRKKEREEEQQVGLQRMETVTRELERRNQDLEGHIADLEAERDFYRGERNRLRDIVARTPATSELADRGPPTPKFTRAAGSAETSSELGKRPLAQTQHQQHQQQQQQQQQPSSTHPYPAAAQTYHQLPSSYMSSSSDPSMIERPAQRRRTDPEPLFSTPVYGAGPRSTSPLPPITAMPTSPRAPPSTTENTTSPESARLPPLRFEQPSPTPSLDRVSSAQGGTSAPPHPVPQAQQPQQPATTQASQYPSYNRSAAYEMGWVTGPRGPREGDSR